MTIITTKKYYNGLGDADYLLVFDGAIEVSAEIANISVSTKVTDILFGNPIGKPLVFDRFILDCTCGERDCNSYAVIFDDGSITVRREDGDRYNTKIDQRYCSRIYEYWLTLQKAKAKRKVKNEANRNKSND